VLRAVDDGREAVLDGGASLGEVVHSAQHQDRHRDPCIAQDRRLGDGEDREPLAAARHQPLRHRPGAVPVCVGLDHGKHRTAARQPLRQSVVGCQSLEIDAGSGRSQQDGPPGARAPGA
jgi:hypothetical protein